LLSILVRGMLHYFGGCIVTDVSEDRSARLLDAADEGTTLLRNVSNYLPNTLYYLQRSNQLILCSEMIAVCSEIHTKHINTVRTAQ
jgi:hypothetical protein